MTIRFHRYDAAGAREQRAVVRRVYERAYADAIASSNPFEQPGPFMERFDAYTDPARSTATGFALVIATDGAEPVGQSWGWPLDERAGAGWWRGLQLDDGDPADFTREDGRRTFALSEIMVAKEQAGRGIGRALHDELLDGRAEQRATLLVDPVNDRAYERYARWGWSKAGTLRPDWPDAPTFRRIDPAASRPCRLNRWPTAPEALNPRPPPAEGGEATAVRGEVVELSEPADAAMAMNRHLGRS
ncbi:GNAT family N-acetyltransferase [Nocardia sp. NPDC050697]|uniref:GNAT family N-acetyltransferase n=1 Tax=Nocardia sp. NPDC050697 TaxID=3155158 RepID=UPI0033C93346